MYLLLDTFNHRVISRHLSLRTVFDARLRFDRAVTRANGNSSYIPTTIKREGEVRSSYDIAIPLTESEIDQLGALEYAR